MLKRDIIVIGSSAGGVQTLGALLSQLPSDFHATLFITVHLAPDHRSRLPEILQRSSSLPVAFAADRDKIQAGRVYVAPPNYHMVLEAKHIRITQGPKENRFRPAIDVLFRSAALACEVRVIGVILTGVLDDGSSGLYAIKARSGLAIVQDPSEAQFPSMPLNAIKTVRVDHVVPVGAMGELLERLTSEAVDEPKRSPVSKQMESEVGIAMGDNGRMREIMALGKFTPYTCPECHGALISLQEGRLTRFRCHTGHAYTLSHLMSELTQHTENAIMNALRAVEETELLMSEMKKHLQDDNQPEVAQLLEEKLKQAEKRAALIKQAARENEVISQDTLEGL
jgi:two-component system, chemotaxis family, protein-glutamate methylesterase/glutaminase